MSSSSNTRLAVAAASSFLAGIAVSQIGWPWLRAAWYRRRRRIRQQLQQRQQRNQLEEQTKNSRKQRQSQVVDGTSTLPQNNHDNTDLPALLSSFERQLQNQPRKKKELCIGSIFGLDVGGTLTKLAYFEPTDRSSVRMMTGDTIPTDTFHSTTDLTSLMEPFVSTAGTSALYYGRSRQQQHQRHHSSIQDLNRLPSATRSISDSTTGSSNSTSTTFQKRWKPLPSSNPTRPISVPPHLSEDEPAEDTHPLIRSRRSVPHNLQSLDDTALPRSNRRRTRSMDNLVMLHNAALDVFYAFARQSRTSPAPFSRTDDPESSTTAATCRSPSASSTPTTNKSNNRILPSTTPVSSLYSPALGGDFHLYRFPTQQLPVAMDAMRHHKLHWTISQVGATGGGAHKFAPTVQRELGITMQKQDEMDSLVAGLQFVLASSSTTTATANECYTYKNHPENAQTKSGDAWQQWSVKEPVVVVPTTPTISDQSASGTSNDDLSSQQQQQYPYLVVVVGTGVSVLRVDGPRKYERVSGSTIGGGTFLGLMRVLTDFEEFDDGLRMAEQGDHSKVDMMVGDIYGDDNHEALEKLGLSAAIVASSFGKVTANARARNHESSSDTDRIQQDDLARALLLMITNNIGQVAHLNAKLYKTQRIYFVGNFLRHNTISQQKLSFAINYWSQGEMQALFLEHEGYFGALGAFLLSQGISIDGAGVRQWRYQGASSLASSSSS